MQRALDVIELSTPDPAKRKSTALRLGNLQDLTSFPHSKKPSQETDPGVKAVMDETVHKLRLLDPDPQVRQQAVDFFGAARAEAALSRLRELRTRRRIRRCTPPSRRHAAIEEFLQIRNAVAYVFNGLSLASILLIMSLGLAITFGLMGIINMAHGEMLMLGSYTAYVMQECLRHSPGWLSEPIFSSSLYRCQSWWLAWSACSWNVAFCGSCTVGRWRVSSLPGVLA